MNNVVLMTNYVMGKMRRIYFMSLPENRRDYKKSRVCYTVGDSAAQTIVQLAGGTFLATLMGVLGISDGNIGVIASISSLAAIANLISMKLSAKLEKNKLFVCVTVMQKFWLAFMFFIPLLEISSGMKQILMVACYALAQISIQVGTPATVDWVASLIPTKLRGRYYSIKDSIAVFVIVTVMLIMGIFVDTVKEININIGFVVLGLVIALLTLINVVSFSKMKEPKISKTDGAGKEIHGSLVKKTRSSADRKPDISIIKETKAAFKSKGFRKILILNGLWLTAFYSASPFNSSYQIKDLSLPYTYIMILSFVTNMLRIYLTPKAGKLADKLGMDRVLKWALSAMGLHYLMMTLSRPANAYVMAACASTFSALGWTFVGIGMLGVQLEYLDEKKRIVQYALFAMISGVYGFCVSFFAGRALDFFQGLNLSIAGNKIYAQQVTNITGVLFVIITVIYLSKSIINGEKNKVEEKKTENDKNVV
ncbi:MFS transporter [Lachnospiraceae bacterium OttesenSCG-928-D06]|nr:MFS transporter [Lachnospiraceae bacterium OttesenSCG-928-D06]